VPLINVEKNEKKKNQPCYVSGESERKNDDFFVGATLPIEMDFFN